MTDFLNMGMFSIPEERRAWLIEEIKGADEWARKEKTSLPDDFDPRGFAGIDLEAQMIKFIASFSASSEFEERDKAEILVCVLSNVLGGLLAEGVNSPDEILNRTSKVADRIHAMMTHDYLAKKARGFAP